MFVRKECVENRFPQRERFGRRVNYSWCIVTCVVQCKHSRLEGQSIWSRLLMITLGAALYSSWNTNQKCFKNLKNLKSQLPTLVAERGLTFFFEFVSSFRRSQSGTLAFALFKIRKGSKSTFIKGSTLKRCSRSLGKQKQNRCPHLLI